MLKPSPITPYLTVSNAAEAIRFYQHALGATLEGEAHLMPNTDKIMHARLGIAGGLIMLADDFSEQMGQPSMAPTALGGSPVVLSIAVDDAQAFWNRAVAGGVTVTMPLAKMFWGEIYGQFSDPFGHRWSCSQSVRELSEDEMRHAAEDELNKRGTLMGEPIEKR